MSRRDNEFRNRSTSGWLLGMAALMMPYIVAPGVLRAAEPEQNGSGHIIWDEPPGGGGVQPQAAPSAPDSGAPIRDNYAAQARLSPPAMSSARSGQVGPCREFQQRITIEGRQQLAHGTACRQPDGSWRITN